MISFELFDIIIKSSLVKNALKYWFCANAWPIALRSTWSSLVSKLCKRRLHEAVEEKGEKEGERITRKRAEGFLKKKNKK